MNTFKSQITANTVETVKAQVLIVRKDDASKIATFNNKVYASKYFPTKESAVEFIQNFDERLQKRYEGRLISARQLKGIVDFDGDFSKIFTEKQKNEVYYLG